MVIKPTIGRRVWYWPSPHDVDIRTGLGMTQNDGDQPFDAGVAYVWSDRMVNVSVADHSGKVHWRTSVPLLQEGDPQPADGAPYCQWMPYQQGMAKGDRPAPPPATDAHVAAGSSLFSDPAKIKQAGLQGDAS